MPFEHGCRGSKRPGVAFAPALFLASTIGHSGPVTYALIPHPDFPGSAVKKVDVDVRIAPGGLLLIYHVYGAVPALPGSATPRRVDGLWNTTCFELFLRPRDREGYVELNFSPSSEWAAYAFDSYRAGMRDLSLRGDPVIERVWRDDDAAFSIAIEVDLSDLPDVPLQGSCTAVIEEADGTKSYWALAHPAGKPDFHDPACFVLELAAAKAP